MLFYVGFNKFKKKILDFLGNIGYNYYWYKLTIRVSVSTTAENG